MRALAPARHSNDAAWALGYLSRKWRQRDPLTVSEWADAHRRLSSKASNEPGPWRTARAPYLREIMDCLSDESPVKRVVVMKFAQGGFTEAAFNWLGYVMDHVRSSKPMGIVVPNEKLQKSLLAERLRPMIQGTPALHRIIDVSKRRDGSNTIDLIDYPGGLLHLASAGTVNSLISKSLRFVILDEFDKFLWDIQGLGDPLAMIESRLANFPRRKLFIVSTPGNKGASRIESEYENTDRRRYLVPCPSCEERLLLKWDNVQWSPLGDRVWYACQECGSVIEEHEKEDMLAGGTWSPERPHPARGYQIGALYSPPGLGYSWPELAGQWQRAQGRPERMKVFITERMGLPYEDPTTAVDQTQVHQRAEPYRLRTPPDGCWVLVAGVDTQDNRFAVQILGFGPGNGTALQWWVLDYHEIHGSPSRTDTQLQLAEYLNEPLVNEFGYAIPISVSAIDMQGHHANDVKLFVASRRVRYPIIAIRGSNTIMDRVLGRPRKTDVTQTGRTLKHGAEYWPVGTEAAKKYLFKCLREDGEPECDIDQRQGRFSTELDGEYYHQLLSETYDPRSNRFIEKKGHPRHEVLDTWVYAYAAAHHSWVRIDRMSERKWAALERRYGVAAKSVGESTPDTPAVSPVDPDISKFHIFRSNHD